ncbi:MaoC family dehydratase [Acinetobacter faecalis]|uniref:MaoC family dehydratase n=1 Tax=Acinetobacter faecalis TaxID=2665161 RepID=UPI002A90F3B8|nr:MaoC family dehydratase [Acinetobacter faecalis]MDY6450138.1 MaoC family dehydratase [Acinetobacter faecalis]
MKAILDKINIDDSFEMSRQFSEKDVVLFSKLSGDLNPIHLNEEYAKGSVFGGRIVHGALATSIFSSIFANTLPGEGSIYLKSSFKFVKPIPLDTYVTYSVRVIDKIESKKRVVFETIAMINNMLCITGTAELYIPSE